MPTVDFATATDGDLVDHAIGEKLGPIATVVSSATFIALLYVVCGLVTLVAGMIRNWVYVAKRWTAACGIALLAGIVLYTRYVEPIWLDVNIHDVGVPKPLDRIRVGQLSDLHLQAVGRRETAIAEALQQLKPALPILTSYVIDRHLASRFGRIGLNPIKHP